MGYYSSEFYISNKLFISVMGQIAITRGALLGHALQRCAQSVTRETSIEGT